MPVFFPENPLFGVSMNPDKTLKIHTYEGTSPILDIPEKIGNFTVAKIAAGFCMNRDDIRTVNMPDTINSIGKDAFANCLELKNIRLSEKLKEIPADFCYLTKIKSIKIPDSVTKIRKGAFENCTKLKEVELGKGLKQIGKYAFANCGTEEYYLGPNVEYIERSLGCFCSNPNLKKIVVDKDNLHFRDIDGVLFSKDGKTLIKFPQNAQNDFDKTTKLRYAVPSCTREIATGAFTGCILEEIKIHKNVEQINYCFSFDVVESGVISITCQKGSAAEKFAEQHGIRTNLISKSINDFLEEVSENEQKCK